jgi:hypothetical protein
MKEKKSASRPAPSNSSKRPKDEEQEAAQKLARPPKDRREIVIGPTTESIGPDISIE